MLGSIEDEDSWSEGAGWRDRGNMGDLGVENMQGKQQLTRTLLRVFIRSHFVKDRGVSMLPMN